MKINIFNTALVAALLMYGFAYAEDNDKNAIIAAEHFINKAHRLAADKKYQEAVTEYTKSIEINPTAKAHRMRGAMYLRVGKQAEALADFDSTITLEPNNPEHYVIRAITYQLKGDNIKAIEDYSSAIDLKPNAARWLSNRGLAYLRIKEFENAENDFNKSLEIWPSYPEALYNRGLIRHNKEDFEGAIADYEAALHLKPKWIDVKKKLIMAERKMPIQLN